MKYAAKPRRELGFRTVFNMLGPLTNPARASYQLIGVYDSSLTEKLAEALIMLGIERAMVVHGLDGLDEISTTVPTKVTEVIQRDIVLMNAGAAFVVAGRAATLKEGLMIAAKSVDSGAALAKLEELKTFSQGYKEDLI
jgi:anthranilate phosphoribosyltransferase